jgi:hypothetical protein
MNRLQFELRIVNGLACARIAQRSADPLSNRQLFAPINQCSHMKNEFPQGGTFFLGSLDFLNS